jgi:hypothetical protein
MADCDLARAGCRRLRLFRRSRSVNFIDQDVPAGGMTATTDFTGHIARGGLNYRL